MSQNPRHPAASFAAASAAMPLPNALPSIAALATSQGVPPAGSPTEPVLDIHDIQGNSLVGFNSDAQAFLFFRIDEVAAAKRSLRALLPRVATVEEVLAFRRLYRALRARRGRVAGSVAATWLNLAVSSPGIAKLTSQDEADRFTSDAFKLGMAARAALLGDDTDVHGNPVGWMVGHKAMTPDLLVILASDSVEALEAELERVCAMVAGLTLQHVERGHNLPGRLSGHEHFGFKDGISQPGVRGRVSDAPTDFLTPRLIDPSDPLALSHAKPGQPLVWPGQFVLGRQYPVQSALDEVTPQVNVDPQPAWAVNGSFLVFRRLTQNVPGFWKFARDMATELAGKHPSLAGLTATHFASLLVGRWPSGAPIMRTPDADDEAMAAHRIAVNDFQFALATPSVKLLPEAADPPDQFSAAPADDEGVRCPFGAHVRKVNPRDDTTELGGSERTLLKRILRRGIPFGMALADPMRPSRSKADRGLLFVSYQASIEDQFEFLMTDWANSIVNPRAYPGAADDIPAGHDPIIGQQGSPNRQRTFTLPIDGVPTTFTVPRDFVTTTGGGYFFAPSITALKTVLST